MYHAFLGYISYQTKFIPTGIIIACSDNAIICSLKRCINYLNDVTKSLKSVLNEFLLTQIT